MKQLIVLRHAKSKHKHLGQMDDHERPLSKKGLESCETMARYIESQQLLPNYILCSDAKRTVETWLETNKTLKLNIQAQLNHKLYLATPGELIKEIAHVPDSIETLLLIGHNPGIQQLALYLSAHHKHNPLHQELQHYPTACLASFSCNIEQWKDIAPEHCTPTHYAIPKH